jgi:hypothetical protein
MWPKPFDEPVMNQTLDPSVMGVLSLGFALLFGATPVRATYS